MPAGHRAATSNRRCRLYVQVDRRGVLKSGLACVRQLRLQLGEFDDSDLIAICERVFAFMIMTIGRLHLIRSGGNNGKTHDIEEKG